MCSIAGMYNVSAPVDINMLRIMNESMQHRGPDDNDVYVNENVGLAHNRLSILDLSKAGHQPMVSANTRYVIVFNGEIYNHLEIRKEYLNTFSFKGNSDTETILELFSTFLEQGKPFETALNPLNGMFTFALWDNYRKTLYIARDRLGIKPLYYKRDGKNFIFASEMKAIQKTSPLSISQKGISNYFLYGHSINSETIFEDVCKLPAGTYYKIDRNGLEKVKYWQHDNKEYAFTGSSYGECKEQLLQLISDAVKKQLISDVPCGAFLSGGVDSSIIVALMQKHHGSSINTFSVGFNIKSKSGDPRYGGKYSELHDAAVVAQQIGSIHHQIVPGTNDIVHLIDKIVYQYDEPFADPAAFPTYIISALAKQHVTVCLSGEGADELFGGYRRYKAHVWTGKHRFLSAGYALGIDIFSPILPRLRRMRKIAAAAKCKDPVKRYSIWLEALEQEEYRQLIGKEIECNPQYDAIYAKHGTDCGKFLLLADQKTWLVDCYLEKLDKASMANSLEARVPFLDHRIVEFANSLPTKWKIADTTKKIFKDAIRGTIPDYIIDKPKKGFTVPLDEWFRGDLKNFLRERLFASGFDYKAYNLNKEIIEKIYSSHISMKRDNSTFLWQILIFISWINNSIK